MITDAETIQLSLEFDPILDVEGSSRMTLRDAFEAFHWANPHVARNLRRLARDLRDRGVVRYSIAALFEVLRWSYAIQTSRTAVDGEFKLNNSYRAFYARYLMEIDPDLADFFEVREQKSADREIRIDG